MNRLLPVSLALNVILSVALLLTMFLQTAAAGRSDYIPPGLVVRMTPNDVAAVADQDLKRMEDSAAGYGLAPGKPERILSVIAAKSEDVGSIEPRAAGTIQPGATVWVVRAEGTFVANRVIGQPRVFSSGYFIIDDSLAQIVSDGMP